MIALAYAIIGVVFVILAFGGIFMLDHWFSQRVGDRPFAIKGRQIESDDPFVRRQFRLFSLAKVFYCFGLIGLLIAVVSNVG